MKKLLLIILLLIGTLIYSQTQPPPAPAPPTANEESNTTQNSIIGAQSKSFGGGSLVKPNPMLTYADFVLLQNPTYESGWRYGTSLCFNKISNRKGFGINAVIAFDLTQQSYSSYYRNKNWYYHFNFGKMGTTHNIGGSVTNMKLTKKLNYGYQIGASVVEDSENIYFILVPYAVIMANREITLSSKVNWTPEAFITVCSPYYDLGIKEGKTSDTFNAVVGNNISLKVSKTFKMNINWRMNINTTPKFGIMNNVLIGGNIDF